jgi:hypothetical protein
MTEGLLLQPHIIRQNMYAGACNDRPINHKERQLLTSCCWENAAPFAGSFERSPIAEGMRPVNLRNTRNLSEPDLRAGGPVL